jgi:D-alanyl-lipoteichoic acid acyltransferase DltB (MBOAT superfamily)
MKEPTQTTGNSRTATGVGTVSIQGLLIICAQLALLLLLFRQFQIESAAFLRLAMLAFGGFIVHALLPLRLRPPFFVLLSLAGIGIVLGFVNGAWLVGIGLVLIGICHIPASFKIRAALLMLAGGLLMLQRARMAPFPWSEAIWPILGSMFMFRLIVYFYDLRHDKTRGTLWQSLSYFFMLPNACFPLYPVIDYKTYRRNYYDEDAYRIYQVGVDWMVRGVVHLILYRLVYYHFTLAPYEITTPAALSQHLVSNFLLYLRVSGLFHLIIGMLYLFGFRMPETHNRYLLASSFTDFWRRINIYWKDFMQKVFYYPAIFKLRGLGTTKALVVATLYVFVMTWFLHAYQWFWLRGTLLFVLQDILFWTILGVLVVINSLYEIRFGRKRSLVKPVQTWRSVASHSLKSYAIFWFICVLWSFWTADSLADWRSIWSALAGKYSWEVLTFPMIVFAVIVLGNIPSDSVRNIKASQSAPKDWMRERLVTLAIMASLIGFSVERVHRSLGPEVATFAHSLRSGRLSRLDTAKLERGYYENLLSVDRFNSQLWEVYTQKPTNWLDVENANLKRFTGRFAQTELVSSFVSVSKWGTISINRWGMRDQDYSETPAPNTYRAVVLGASSVMGWGVGDGETFEALLETRMNLEYRGKPFDHYELLNAGVPGYQPPQQLEAVDKALKFKPNAIIFVATGREINRSLIYIAEVVRKGIKIPYEPLADVVRKAGITSGMDEATALKRLQRFGREVLTFVYGYVADQSRRVGAVPVWVFLPQAREGVWQEEVPETIAIARSAGFQIIDLQDLYKGQDISSLRLAEWDDHPTQKGHQLIADRLFDAIQANRSGIVDAAKAMRPTRLQ